MSLWLPCGLLSSAEATSPSVERLLWRHSYLHQTGMTACGHFHPVGGRCNKGVTVFWPTLYSHQHVTKSVDSRCAWHAWETTPLSLIDTAAHSRNSCGDGRSSSTAHAPGTTACSQLCMQSGTASCCCAPWVLTVCSNSCRLLTTAD